MRGDRSGGARVAVTSSADMLSRDLHTAEQAREVLQATHVLQVTLRHDGNAIEAKASVIELATQAHLQEFSARYAPEIAEDMPKALAGVVSSALRLRGDTASDVISPSARAAYDRALYSFDRVR